VSHERGALDWRLGLGEVAGGLGRRPEFGGVVERLEIGVEGLGRVRGLGWRLGLDKVEGWLVALLLVGHV
jgi:hypothetical protein